VLRGNGPDIALISGARVQSKDRDIREKIPSVCWASCRIHTLNQSVHFSLKTKGNTDLPSSKSDRECVSDGRFLVTSARCAIRLLSGAGVICGLVGNDHSKQ
jgi:hypothetical protein